MLTPHSSFDLPCVKIGKNILGAFAVAHAHFETEIPALPLDRVKLVEMGRK